MLNHTEKIRKYGRRKEALLAAIAVLALAGQCFAAAGTSVVPSVTNPGGFIYDGVNLWVTDGSLGFCQIAGGLLTNCVKPPTNNLAVPAVLGAPAYDAVNHLVYLPDKSSASLGIWRYALPSGGLVNTLTQFNVAAPAGLGGQRPGAISFDSVDGNLYTSMAGNSNILRIHTPAGASQTVDSMSTTLNGKPAGGLAIVGAQLWVAESDGILLIPDPVGCGNKCRGGLDTQLTLNSAFSITYDSPRGLIYIGNDVGAFRYNVTTGLFELYSASFVSGGVTGLYSNVQAIGVDSTGNLYIGNDPTLGQTVGGATIYAVPAGSAPDGVPPSPIAPPTPVPTIFSNAIANPGTQVLNAVLTAPTGAVWMGTHMWVANATSFCRVDPGTAAPSLTNCAVLPAGVTPGGPAFDPTGNWVYIPDSSGTAGIIKLPFLTGGQTVGAATTVVANSVLAAVSGVVKGGPAALAFGPDLQLYANMGGSLNILRITAPATALHTVKIIGTMNDPTISMAFHKADLWGVGKAGSNFIFNATLCGGTCTATFLGVFMQTPPPALTADANLVYISDATNVWAFDSVANTMQLLADTGRLANGSLTPFVGVTALALDGLGAVYAADAGPLWKIKSSGPSLQSIVPGSGVRGTSVPVVITGLNLAGGTLNMPAGIIASGVTISAAGDQITANFNISATTTTGAKTFNVVVGGVASNTLGFVVNAAGPVLTTLTISPQPPPPAPVPSAVAGTTVALTLTGSNLLGATLNLPTGVTATGVATTATSVSATLTVALTAPLGLTSISVTNSGIGSNALAFSVVPPPPTVTSITPNSGVIGTNVAVAMVGTFLTGSTINFPVGSGITLLAPPAISATQINATFVIALAAPQVPQNITVTTVGGTSLPVVFTVKPPPPVITSIAPTSGAAGTGVPVLITGTNLTGSILSSSLGLAITATGVTTTATTVNATLNISVTATQGLANIFVTTPGGASNNVAFTVLPPPPPTLSTIGPTSGITGTTVAVTLSGTNLLGTSAINAGTGITVSSLAVVSSTSVTASFVIAAAATLGPHNVTITTPGGTSAVPVVFTVVPPAPTLTSINPTSGNQGASVPVTIVGTNLTGATLTLPSGVTTSVAPTVTATQITATLVIAANAAPGPQNITVTTAGGPSNALTFTVIPPPPTLTSITPNVGVQGTTNFAVTLAGTNLVGATLNLPSGVTTSAAPVVTAISITASLNIAANATLGLQNITVTTAGGTSAAVTFTVNPPAPTLTSIAPTSGAQGATLTGVTLTGTNLTGATVINAGAGITVSNLAVVNSTTVTATFAIGASATTGPQNVTITTAGGTSVVGPAVFTINQAGPTLTSIAPTSGAQGATLNNVTLTGTNLTGATVINAGAGITVTNLVVVNATSVTATFAIGVNAATGPQNVTITTPGGTSAVGPAVFTINPPAPTLTSIAPNFGAQGASVPVTITGTFLAGATLNLPAGITASGTLTNATTITTTLAIPAGAPTGAQNITVTTTGGTSGAVAFTINPPAPALSGIAPPSGTVATSVPVTISGTNLTGATLNLPASITTSAAPVVTATSITATFVISNTATAGPQNITVSNAGGTSNAAVFTITAPTGPTLSGISPALAVVGVSTPVTISGVALTGGTLNVPAGITASAVTVVNDTTITATFVGTAVGPQSITVTSPTAVVSNALTFTVNPPAPTLAGIAPGSGLQGTSVGVTLTGTALTGATLNLPAGITATGVAVTDTQITATLVISASAASGSVSVTTAGGTSNGLAFTVLPPAPVLASIAPPSAAQGASVAVTITGTNLAGATVGAIPDISVSGVTSTATSVSATFLIDPAAGLGPQGVTVTTPSGTSNAVTFTINPPAPVLANISPTSGVTGTSLSVTINGSNLTGATLNSSANIAASGVTVSATQITATFTLGAAGAGSVSVTTAGGTSNALSFTILPPAPALTGIAPTSGVAGTSFAVTLSGSNLTGATVNAIPGITVTGVTSTATSVSATFAISAAAAPGPQGVTVTTAGGTSNAATFTVLPPAPALASILPASGVTGANNVSVTINGSNLTGATLNTSANITASGVTVNATSITATFALGAVGAGSVSVTTPSGTSNALSFTVNPPAPALTGIAPTSGLQGTSFGVTLSGSNLTGATINPIAGIAISGVSSTATSVSATFTIAANAAVGPQNVIVTTAGGASNAVTFTINPGAPTLTGIAPTSGAQGAAVSVTISGTNLTGATVNPVAGVTISGVTTTATSISATFTIAAAAATGAQSVTVTTASGTSNAVTFTINSAAPTISSITPSTIVRNSSTTMSIVGTGFAAGATVHATPAAGITFGTVTVVDSSHISVPITVANKAATGNHSLTVTVGAVTSNAVTLTIQ